MTTVRCSYWEFGAVVRHERQRHEAGLVRGVLGRRKFVVPSFVTSRNSGLEEPADPDAVLAEAERSIRRRGWIEEDGQLADQPYEFVTALVHGSSCGFLQIGDPDADEVRVVVAVQQGLAFRIWMCRDEVVIDEVRAADAWKALAAYLPSAEPAEGRPVTVPSSLLAEVAEATDGPGEHHLRMAHALRERGVPAERARALGEYNRMVDRTTTQIAVAARDTRGALHIGPRAINLHHAPSGRVAIVRQPPDGSTTTVGPADLATVADTTERLVRELHEDLGDE
ncbi:ESX secretion-associated protein EspG [Actinopolyspora mortivallis]|uniref:ESX secretion-associated protein EspG n=1 Tax=Actinopolyspora mortivallis TaxID=33906 RepID=UPI000372F564|nr:ESX secretion-associated protein EspG [Actinopolyspora mortivallis]